MRDGGSGVIFYLYLVLKPTIFFILLLVGVSSKVQANLDSLWSVWSDTAQQDTLRLQAINTIAREIYLNSKPDSSLHLAGMQYDLADATVIKNGWHKIKIEKLHPNPHHANVIDLLKISFPTIEFFLDKLVLEIHVFVLDTEQKAPEIGGFVFLSVFPTKLIRKSV